MYDAQSTRTIRSGSRNGEQASRIRNESIEDTLQDDADKDDSEVIYGSWAFEDALHVSRVYQRTHSYNVEDVSFRSSTVRTHAWSVLSAMSLSQVSAISVVALPVYAQDVFNHERYSFGMPQPPPPPPTLPPPDNNLGVEARRRPRCRVIVAGEAHQLIKDINVSQVRTVHCIIFPCIYMYIYMYIKRAYQLRQLQLSSSAFYHSASLKARLQASSGRGSDR